MTPRVRIPGWELRLSYATSSGPGGQNVNKVESKAVLRWNPAASGALSRDDKALVLARLGSRLASDGDLVLASDRHRDQPRNVEDVLERLCELLRTALYRTPARRATRPTRGSRERRLSGKRRRGEVKRDRRGGGED